MKTIAYNFEFIDLAFIIFICIAFTIMGIGVGLSIEGEKMNNLGKHIVKEKYGYYNENKELVIYDEYKKYYIGSDVDEN